METMGSSSWPAREAAVWSIFELREELMAPTIKSKSLA